MKILITISLLVSNFFVLAQKKEKNKITIKGVATHGGNYHGTKRLGGVELHIYEYNKKVDSYCVDDRGRFEISIPLNSYMVLEFQKKGFVSKRFLFDIRGVPTAGKRKPFDIEITMLKHVVGIDYGDLDFPITRIAYNQEIDDLDYDVKYTSLMLKRQEEIKLEQERMLSLGID